MVIVDLQARPTTYYTVDVDGFPAVATYEMMMVVVHPLLISRGGSRWLNPSDDRPVRKHCEGVVNGLS